MKSDLKTGEMKPGFYAIGVRDGEERIITQEHYPDFEKAKRIAESVIGYYDSLRVVHVKEDGTAECPWELKDARSAPKVTV